MMKIFFIIFLFSISAQADLEIAESHKCSKLFPHFEKKLSIPNNTLHSIALHESGKKHKEHKIKVVWPWTVNVEGKGYYFNSKREAIKFVKQQIIKGKDSIDVGCMQINLKHHLDAFASLDEAFDPKNNVRYGAEFLRSKYDQLGNWHQAIAHYHSATPSLGSKYKQNIIKIANNMTLYKASLNNYSGYNYYESVKNPILKNKAPQKKHIFALNGENKKYKSNMMVPIPLKNR